jgi:hypothetical protein
MKNEACVKCRRSNNAQKWFDQFDNTTAMESVLKVAKIAPGSSIQEMNEVEVSKHSSTYLLIVKDNESGNVMKVAVDITSELPCWDHVEKYLYGKYEDVDKVIIVQESWEDFTVETIMFNIRYQIVLSLVHIANSCGKQIALIETSPNHYKPNDLESMMSLIKIDRNDIGFNKLPSKKELMEAQFWNEYHKIWSCNPYGFGSHPEVWFNDPCSMDFLDMKLQVTFEEGKILIKLIEQPDSVGFSAYVEPKLDDIKQLYKDQYVTINKNTYGLKELTIDLGSEVYDTCTDCELDSFDRSFPVETIVAQERSLIWNLYGLLHLKLNNRNY